MKPCSKNRKLIACLVLDGLKADEARSLRHHLESCAGCRAYHTELLLTTQKLGTVAPRTDIQATEAFHQRLLSSLRAEPQPSPWQSALLSLRRSLLDWRVALPVAGAAAILIFAFSVQPRQPEVSLPVVSAQQAIPSTVPQPDLDPTIFNYQTVASRSVDKLDELLTRQGNKGSASTPIYTASSLGAVNSLE